METKNKINYTKVLLVILFMLVIVLNVVMYRKGFYKANVESIMYKEDNSINYKVYLKKNNFFDVPYLEEDKTYITSLIDYIKVNCEAAALLRVSVNPDPSSFYPVKGEGQYVDNVIKVENKEQMKPQISIRKEIQSE